MSPERRVIGSPLKWTCVECGAPHCHRQVRWSSAMEMTRIHYILGWGYVAICIALLLGARGQMTDDETASVVRSAATTTPAPRSAAGDAEEWWRRARPYCNAVEVRVLQRQTAPPATVAGAGYQAACFALAGQIDEARKIIDRLAPN